MIAVLINAGAVALGAVIGLLSRSRINDRLCSAIMTAIALVTMVIGVQSALGTSDILIVIVCMVVGTLIGTLLHLDERMNSAGERLKNRLRGTKLGNGPMVEAFLTTTFLFCIGTMTVVGSIEAGIEHNYQILLAKSVLDFMSAIVFSAALGAGGFLSVGSVLVIQGGIVLLSGVLAPALTPELITEMSAVGGTIFIGMAFNLLGLSEKKIAVGDMIPGLFLPILTLPLADWLGHLF